MATTRYLVLTFEVDADAVITDDELYDLGDRIVATIEPDPPVLTLDGITVEKRATS